MDRWIDLDGVVNMRDLGGLPTRDGGRIQAHRLIRSDNLQDLSRADVSRLIGLGVSDIVDLRSNTEVQVSGDGPLRATPLRHHHHSFFPEARNDRAGAAAKDWRAGTQDMVKDASFWSQHYRGYLTGRPDSVTAALSVVATATGGTIVHCAAGKDRTGTVVGLALAVAGVPDELIVEDYVLTSERLEAIMARLIARQPYAESLAGRDHAEQIPLAASMEALLGFLADAGGADGWLREHGWTADEVDALQAKLLTP